jgi:hypothetical protein
LRDWLRLVDADRASWLALAGLWRGRPGKEEFNRESRKAVRVDPGECARQGE